MPWKSRHAAHGWTPKSRRFLRAIHTLDRFVYETIAKRRAEANGASSSRPDDLLSMLVLATDADGGPALSDVEVRDELMTIFFAGHETSAAALAALALAIVLGVAGVVVDRRVARSAARSAA